MLKKKYIAALALILTVGCKKAPVNVGSPSAYSSSSYPTTITQLQTVLVSCYANLRDIGLFGFDLMPRALAQATHTVNSQFKGFTAINEMAGNNLSVGNQYAQETWSACYTGIKNCNVTIYAAGVLQKTDPSISQTDINLILGQAYCLRGWYYMQLECYFGQAYMQAGGANGSDLGVPLYTAVPQDLDQTQVARSSVSDTWALIENDFKQAATLLQGQVWDAADAARVTEWSAKGLLGKAYVYTQDWADAKTVLNDVISNSSKTLMPYSTYHDAFNGNNKFNTESLFELYIDPNPMGGYGIYSGAANSSTIDGLIWSPWTFGGYEGNGAPFDGTQNDLTTMGYSNEFFHDQNVIRFGYTLGSNYSLVPNPNYNAATGPTYFNQQLVMDPVYKQAALQARTNNTTDPRLYVCGLQPRIDSVQFDGTHWALVALPSGYSGYGFSMRKYSPINYNENSINSDAWDYYLLRLADVYLLYAEACIGTADNVDGLEYINKVRRRAYSLPVNTASAIDYKSLTDATPAANPVDPDPVLGHNPLYYERWAELFNEGHWWFDVCRWKIGDSEAAYFGSAINVNGSLASMFTDSKSYVWPIPLNEINSNSKVKQNQGY
jgi:starch-binding outer membrane protein, SusD/RagB family